MVGLQIPCSNQEKTVTDAVYPSREQAQQLLQRLFSSRHFVHATSLRRILEFVCENTLAPGSDSLKEYEIAVGASLRPSSFDPKADPIIRVSISGIRERLAAFFSNEGREEPLVLTIPKGEYRAVFRPAEPSADRTGGRQSLRVFWADYAAGSRSNLILFAETLFFRDGNGNFIRNIYINDLNQGLDQIENSWPGLKQRGFQPSYHFVSAGEMHSLLAIKSSFDNIGLPLEPRNARFLTWGDLRDANLVVLGSTRTNPFVTTLCRDEPFQLEETIIRNLNPRPGEEAEYKGCHFSEGALERSTDYALVTRRPAMVGAGTVTVVSSNHGRGIEGAGDFLAREESMAAMMGQLRRPDGKLPRHFQLLIRVEMIDFDEEVVEVECISHRVIEV